MSTNNTQQGTTTTRKGKAPSLTLAEVRAQYGDARDAIGGFVKATQAVEDAQAGLAQWVRIAVAFTGTVREWESEAGGDRNSLGRLRDVGSLIAASRKGKGSRTLSYAEAIKVSNANTRGAIAKMVDAMLAGGDPLGTMKKGSEDGGTGNRRGVNPNAGKPRGNTLVTVNAANVAEVLALVGKFAAQADHALAVTIAREAGKVAATATARAASLAQAEGSGKGKRAPMAS